jgi:2-polyprenyl-6-methoxyphenol hydroxylase-like FAD-dependent oxidoreductase
MGKSRAVVVGASLAGLFAARVLHETFDEVLVLDRDVPPDRPEPRRGVPQGRHTHGLLARGLAAIEELFEGFAAELVAAGAVAGDIQQDMHWYLDGRLTAPGRSGMIALAVGRPLLEHVVRQRVAALPGVEIVGDCEVVDLLAAPDRSRITGVGTARRGPLARIEDADLVVDAGGRASRSPVWLRTLGYPAPVEERVEVNITYVSRWYRRTGDELGGRIGTACAAYPGFPYGGLVLAQDGDRFIASISGWMGEVPPTDDYGMALWAERLVTTDIAGIVGGAEPLGEPALMRYPSSVRRRYERLGDFPGGYLVTGDAICSFNPFYGQGMTVVALEAVLLRRLLAAGGTDDLAARFFAGAAELVDPPWSLASGNDLRFPEAVGDRGGRDAQVEQYLTRLRGRLPDDPVLATAFLRVTNLIDPPARLLEPDIRARVLGTAVP